MFPLILTVLNGDNNIGGGGGGGTLIKSLLRAVSISRNTFWGSDFKGHKFSSTQSPTGRIRV